MGAPPDLPSRFPCWVRATYSWGGETKRDLGFVEGDLIEALNAGDGLWWMGRLRRDPRAIGMFPSNFVKVLEDGFQPAPNSRHSTPPQQANTLRAQQGKSFRKPFQAYEKIGSRAEKMAAKQETLPEKPKPKSSFKPFSSMKTAQAPTGTLKGASSNSPTKDTDNGFRMPAPVPRANERRTSRRSRQLSNSPTPTPGYTHDPNANRRSMYRAASPQPMHIAPVPNPYEAPSPSQPMYRAASPNPYRAHSPQPAPLPSSYHDGSAFPQLLPQRSREPSPLQYEAPMPESMYSPRAPSFGYEENPRGQSPAPDFIPDAYLPPAHEMMEDDLGSSPPPPPPPAHRVLYQPSRAPSLEFRDDDPADYDRGHSHTPTPRYNGDGSHNTPSPLRDAMNDVMSSLQDMSLVPESPPTSGQPISSSIWSPDEYEQIRSNSREQMRAHSSLGFARHEQCHGYDDGTRTPSAPSSRDGPPPLDDFVQSMTQRFREPRSNQFSDQPPMPPSHLHSARPTTANSQSSQESSGNGYTLHSQRRHPNLRHQKSAHELGKNRLTRNFTTKTNITDSTNSSSATHSSNSTQLTSRSIMSGHSAGGFSATSAGSLARKKFSLGSIRGGQRPINLTDNKSTPNLHSSARSMAASDFSGSGPSYHESHASENQPIPTPRADWTTDPIENAGVLGGLGTPKAKRSGFFKKMIESARTTAKTGAANARSTIGSTSRPGSRNGAGSPTKGMFGGNGPTGIAGGLASAPSSPEKGVRDMGLGGGSEWMSVRRDVNRSNSISRREREERAERCDMLDLPVLNPIDQLHECAEGDEGLDGLPVDEPTNFFTTHLALVDKSTRFINNAPPMINAAALAQSYICRPHRSDVQRLRAIFTWTAERITWEEEYEAQPDSRRVIQTKRGCSEEIAVLVRDMCNAVGLHCEVIRGYLKCPGEILDVQSIARPNHWWNAVIIDGEWRIMDCALASPTHPKRSLYSSASSQVAENWYFLARPMEICYTHVPLLPEQQHIVPAVDHETLVHLPVSGPAYFRHNVELSDYSTSNLHLENLEMAHFHLNVPEDIEVVAETESRAFERDADGDFFESGETIRKSALAQAEWVAGRKRFAVKAVPPGDDGQATLKIYAGKRGMMHSIKDNPHALALALPITHIGQNPPYDFLTRHPTPHAQRHDLYIVQPQCRRLVMNNTFVFHVRQHPSSLSRFTPDTWGSNSAGAGARAPSPNPMIARPTSAMSMVSGTASVSQSGSDSSSNPAGPMTAAQQKPAKLAIQSPSQKIIRLTRKQEYGNRSGDEVDVGLTTAWETVIKIGERGTWRGLVLADRSARWCVFAEWECA
ncbi:hypothetical protein WHR41_01482 [Cladosporium halotolerans]|uniref:SH3 domain-containing protein n=1 Tax=Cladosporium halotolerans TaxID=1052096 RepID=A0AB34L047_9PEZI